MTVGQPATLCGKRVMLQTNAVNWYTSLPCLTHAEVLLFMENLAFNYIYFQF